MNKERNNKIVSVFKLPSIISDTKVFKELTKNERTVFYSIVNSYIKDINPSLKLHQDLYKRMSLYPTQFLSSRKDINKAIQYSEIFEQSLNEYLMVGLKSFQEKYKEVLLNAKVVQTRIKTLQRDIKKYSKQK